MKNECITKIQSTELPDQLKEEFVNNLNLAKDDNMVSIFGNIVERIQHEASQAMDKVCKYRDTTNEDACWKRYWPLYSSWVALRDYFLTTFKDHKLSPAALKSPDQI